MRKIILSLALILSVGAVTYGVTKAIFTSQAVMGVNTFATGTLQVRLNGQAHLTGFTFSPAAPGDCKTGQFGVNNYGAPYFGGPSNLDAKELVISAEQDGGDTGLYNALTVKVEANRGWPDWMLVYDTDPLNGLFEEDLLQPRWTELIPGSSEDVRYEVCLPADADSSLQGKTALFNFVVDAYNPHR